jgi:hypothetical protein
MYYLNMYPSAQYYVDSDPYFSIAYGSIGGRVGSGSFTVETASIMTSPTYAIYTQYRNLLLGDADSDGLFTMQSGSTTVSANDIWVINMSAYKMKDKIDEGLLEFGLSGSKGTISFIDNSRFLSKTQTVYQLIPGTLSSPPSQPTYGGFGLYYPGNGIIVLNASAVAEALGITTTVGIGKSTGGPLPDGSWPYTPGCATVNYTYNHKTLAESMKITRRTMSIRKSEYVPARHYFVRVQNRDFNYSNNPTYVYDGTDGIHARGTILNADFVNDPRTYITTVGLYNDGNELVAVAKLSRPALKTFDSELTIKIRLDF